MSFRAQRGSTLAEALAALTLVAVGLTASFSILVGVTTRESMLRDAVLRSRAAQHVMERSIATPFDELRSSTIALAPEEVGSRSGWRAEVRVQRLGPGLKSVEVELVGGGRRTRLVTLRAAGGSRG